MQRTWGMRFGRAVVSIAVSTVLPGMAVASADNQPAVSTPSLATGGKAVVDVDNAQVEEPVLGVNWIVERIERVETFADDAPIRIVNHFGDLQLRASGGNDLTVIGAAQYSTVDGVRPVTDIREESGGVIVEVRFPSPVGTGPDLTPSQVGMRRVDLTVLVPGDGRVEIESLDGLVEAKGVPGPLAVHFHSGELRVVAKNNLDLHSVYGEVDVWFDEGIGAFPDLAVETLTGDIRVEFPPGIDRIVRAETNGYLATDFTATIEKTAGSPHKIVHVTLGSGGDVVRLTSNLGMIWILDHPHMSAAAAP